ncbi:Frizzy aggregation protein FrzB [Myxococcus sp. CA051A]|uniref:Frizzy aggregation protein FrzB n=1 Tax=Myxococcus llanfairpwllgwyngyllgogerychwyrndrobwllllantysiliogogogochensis TaxID=2590453 RepID=A0A540WIZ3_9BACT|nr:MULTISPECIES: Frizzy aggregation protein FrzB [Myxococcus]NTX02232.1 Frizzy aggregation protein FrzB [Myxococcus sp. CA040A]NTX17603.1 Frizzy aggregation protein FrzB [Myxococcus sp. CA056]NTX37029.1 Frizzy aggregation protein FrzB [Myxococcus sp. CA033]NTX58283.1 Frizzy aggregation protein FrzB [Myxococcus sp. CA039A]NTX64051.1 Frizzy aggregation protein FrzB [Myxococcus sp. CA051A]
MNDESLVEEKVEEVDILFFEIGSGTFGTDASQVLRIDRSLPEDITLPELGRLSRGHRALVFDTPEGEGHLKVDTVRGVRPIPVTQLRRMPPTAGAASYAVGVCLEEARTVLLIDLVETARTQDSQGRH